jgi:hypothetical protein
MAYIVVFLGQWKTESMTDVEYLCAGIVHPWGCMKYCLQWFPTRVLWRALDPQLKERAEREAVEGLPYPQAASWWRRSGPVILPLPFRAASRILRRLDFVICVCDRSSMIMWLQSKMLAWPHEMLPLRPWFNFSHSASRKREKKRTSALGTLMTEIQQPPNLDPMTGI